MGRVRTKTVKRASRVIIEKFYHRLTTDFHTNKRIIDEITLIASKRLRNKVAGFVTHLMKRIRNGPVRGISIKLQEEEKEKRDTKEPEVSGNQKANERSFIEEDIIEIDMETKELIDLMEMSDMPNIQVIVPYCEDLPIPEPVIRKSVIPAPPLCGLGKF